MMTTTVFIKKVLSNFYIIVLFVWGVSYAQVSIPSVGKIIHYSNFPSKYIASRNVDIWLPDNYEPNKRFSILYMHDGQMLFDSTHTWNHQEWGVDEALDSLIKLGKIRNTIVVGIYNSSNRATDYFPQKPFLQLDTFTQDTLLKIAKMAYPKMNATTVESDNYLKFIVYELKPFVDSVYRPATDKAHTFIAGSSMGALISWYALCEYPTIFGGAACLSTHWIGSMVDTTMKNPIPEKLIDYLSQHLPKSNTYKIYFDYGTQTLDRFYEAFQKKVDSLLYHKKMDKQHFKTLKFVGDSHVDAAWRNRIHIPLQFLLKP
ncbi:MAG: alpha/beta hydrolase [Chitinophagaceae bacterium]